MKAKLSARDIDDLCDLFDEKAKVTPSKKKPSGSKVKYTDGEKAANEENSPLNVIKDGDLFDGLAMASTKKNKKEMKAESLAKAKAWSDARAADGAQESFIKALKAMPSAKSTRVETKEAARTSTRRSAKRGMQ